LLEHATRILPPSMCIAGIGAPATHKSIALGKIADEFQVAAHLAVTPYYVRPTQAGLIAHFLALANALARPIILYNVPTRTGCDLLPETCAGLAPHANIIGVKEARPEADRMRALLELQNEGFSVLCGDDPTALDALRMGARGVISVAANVVPRAFARMCRTARNGDFASAAGLDAQLRELYAVLGIEPNPVPAKFLLHLLRATLAAPRLPLLPPSLASQSAVTAVLEQLRAAHLLDPA
jgi:4-hydroxy-tetrahydrodipicolinate synthase